VNSALWHRLEEGSLSFEELKKNRWNLVFSELGFNADGVKFETYFRERLFDSAIPMEGAMELLEHLKEKYILCAASNGPYHQQVNRLKLGGMLSFFDHLFISEEIGCSKPSREYFQIAFQRLNENRIHPILPEETLIIGDSLSSDIAGGIGYGMQTLFYNPNGKEIPAEKAPDFVVQTLNEIKIIL
jgi:HAD superfamily hydrolase (TIGR01549 family)